MNSNYVDTGKIYEITEEIVSIIKSITSDVESINNSCNSLIRDCTEFMEYNGQEVAGSRTAPTLITTNYSDANNRYEVTWQEWNIRGCDEILSMASSIQKTVADIDEAASATFDLIASSQLTADTVNQYIGKINESMENLTEDQRKVLVDYIAKYKSESEDGEVVGITDENKQWWTDDTLYVDSDKLANGRVPIYQMVDGQKVYMGWVPADKLLNGVNAVQSGSQLEPSTEQKIAEIGKEVEETILGAATAATAAGTAFVNKLFGYDKGIVPSDTSTYKQLNINNIKSGTKVADAYNKYYSELEQAKYATVDENIFTTTIEDTVNGKPVLVTHVVVNNPSQVSGYAANGQYGTGGETVTDMVSDVKQKGENPVVAIFGSHYISGGQQDQTGNAANTNGVIIYDGEIIKDGVTKGNELQLYNDGTIHTSTGQSAQELVDSGVTNTYTCHSVPAIINGSTARSYEETNLYKRNVLGSTNTGEYYVVTDLTYNNALSDTAEYLKNKGCVEAQSLDQGGSVELVINGMIVNNLSDESGERKGADMIYFTS